jgi:diguanylate cyclase (GGDEF)-like protein/PAS domain S-box-containing protein
MTRETTIRVLIVSAADAVIAELRAALEAIGSGTFSIDLVQTASEAMVALRTLPSELTFVDIAGADAGHMRELAQVSSTTADTALIAFTSSGDALASVATLELGAQECLVSGSDDLTPERLMRSLRNAMVRSAHDGSRPLATMIELSSDAILTINRERVVTRFNPAAEELYGWNASEVLGKPAQDLVPDYDDDEQVTFVDRVLRGDSVEAFEVERSMRDGRIVIMSMSGSPIADAFGNVIEACLIIRDVTDQVNARLRLFEQQYLLENSQAAGRIGSWAVDRLTGRIDWSAEHYRLLKRDPSLPPATIDEVLAVVHPDDHELVRRAFSGDVGFTFEARSLADPEDVRILHVRGEYIPRDDGKPGRLLGITQDVTEERAEQAARHLAEEQLRRAFDEALIGMVIIDLDGHPLRVNGALCEIFGRSREELLATTFEELTHPDDRGDDEPVTEALMSGAQKHRVLEKRYIHSDGHTIWTEVAVSLITHPDGKPSHVVGQIQDITERRANVEKLRHMADHDPLTGLFNRRGFDREMSAHVARAQRYGVSGALLMFDLDNFKQHNDSYGHGAGDDLLVALADCLRKRLRATDVIGRLGGDEFAVLLPDAGPPYASLVSQSLLEHIRNISQGLPVITGVTASIGLVCFERLHALSVESAMKCVDLALYEAKHKGRDRFAEWMPSGEIEPASPAE